MHEVEKDIHGRPSRELTLAGSSPERHEEQWLLKLCGNCSSVALPLRRSSINDEHCLTESALVARERHEKVLGFDATLMV